jgi:putative ABC transport system permease protein
VTRALAERLFPDGGRLGQRIENQEGSIVDTIVGIIDVMHGPWPMSSIYDRVMLVPGELHSGRRVRYLVRSEPGMVDTLYGETEATLLRVNDGRIASTSSMAEIEREDFAELLAVNQMLGAVSLLLVAVTSLGMIGLTSFTVTQRTRQIGTRRALGATRFAILRYFLVENWVLTGFGLTLGLVCTYGLNLLLAKLADVPTVAGSTVVGAMVFLWIVGLLATIFPALRGTTVPPVVATRTI